MRLQAVENIVWISTAWWFLLAGIIGISSLWQSGAIGSLTLLGIGGAVVALVVRGVRRGWRLW